jgi:hypothetical protein
LSLYRRYPQDKKKLACSRRPVDLQESPMPPSQQPSASSAKLTKKQQRLLEELQSLVDNPVKRLLWHHSLGDKIRQWREMADGTAVQGDSWLAGKLGLTRSTMVKAARFAKDYPDADEVEELETKNVTWALIVWTQGVEKSQRNTLFKKALKGKRKLNVVELNDLIDSIRPGPRHAGGRRPRVPANLQLGLLHMKLLCSRWLLFHEQVWPQVTAGSTASPAHDAKALLEEMDRLLNKVGKVARQVRGSLKDLDES